MHALFELARAEAQKPSAKWPGQKAGCVVFIDEIDAVCKARGDGGEGSGAERKVTNQFLQELEGVDSNNDGVLFMGATNLPWEIDAAMIRRFQKKILIPLPEMPARVRMFVSAALAGVLRWRPAAYSRSLNADRPECRPLIAGRRLLGRYRPARTLTRSCPARPLACPPNRLPARTLPRVLADAANEPVQPQPGGVGLR